VVDVRRHDGELPDPVVTLERNFARGGVSLVHAVFENTFFVAPEAVRARTPYFPQFARTSREHYPGGGRGSEAIWQATGATVTLADNRRAQAAWARYTRPLSRGTGFGVRHIWGFPWDPQAYTAGWNLAYMPFWAGMLTEAQHPHPVVQQAVRQASWNLFFAENRVCAPPAFVSDPGVDLAELLEGRPLLVLVRAASRRGSRASAGPGSELGAGELVRAIRAERHQSWSNIRKAIAALQGRPHARFGTPNVEASAKSAVRKMCHETGLELGALAAVVDRVADG
jgi:hypothetical protein